MRLATGKHVHFFCAVIDYPTLVFYGSIRTP